MSALLDQNSLSPWRMLLMGFVAWCCVWVRASDAQVGGARPATATDKSKLAREGTEFHNQLGTFRMTGDRAIFTTADNQQIRGLENLNLARIVNTIVDSPDSLTWSVSGVLTEYQGANYLLVTKAIVKNRQTTDVSAVKRKP